MRNEINTSDTRKGLTNGEIKEKMNRKYQRGLTNGAGKGGFTNGAGKGEKGFVNGAGKGGDIGFTNGMGDNSIIEHNESPFYSNRKKPNNKKQFIAFGIFLILVMTLFVHGSGMLDDTSTTIDGNFDEWENAIDLNFANMDIKKDGNNKMLLHLNKQDMFLGNGEKTDSYLIFINDKTVDEGFLLGYDTYEYYIEIYGTNNTMEKVIGYQFDEDREQYDWNGFTSRYSSFSLKRAWDKDNIEIEIRSVQLGKTNLSEISLLVYHFYPTTDFEYSQVVDVDKEATYGEFHIGTRSDYVSYFVQNFVNETLSINTVNPMAYSYLSYEVRIVKEPVITQSTEQLTNQIVVTNNNNTNSPVIPKYVYTNLTIIYENGKQDLIKQCGGVIFSSSLMFVDLNNTGYFIRHINDTVDRCVLDGHFGYQEVYKEVDNTRGSIGIGTNSNPIQNEIMGNITDICSHEFNISRSITIDGVIDEDAWGDPRVCQYTVDEAYNFKLLSTRNSTHIFIGIFSYDDQTITTTDISSVYFDTWDSENTSPNNSSFKRLDASASSTYYEGSGTGWSSTTMPSGWLSSMSTTDYLSVLRRTYEFQIPISDLDVNNIFGLGETIGFGISVDDRKTSGGGQHSYWMWYPDNYQSAYTPTTQYRDKPDTWSDLTHQEDFTAENYVLETYTTDETITIDGILSENDWSNATSFIIHNHDMTECAKVHVMTDDTYLYIALCVANDSSKGDVDFCQIYFDCDYDQTSQADLNDKLVSVSFDNSTAYYEGIGTGWATATAPVGWSQASAFTDGNSTFEFRMTLSDLNETGNFYQEGDIIGFGLHAYDSDGAEGLGQFYFFPDSPQADIRHKDFRYDPDTWGEIILVIPEFSDITIIIFTLLFINIAIYTKRKKGGEYEVE